MADRLVGATAKLLLEKVLSLATDNIGLVFGFKKDVETLRRSVAMIQSVLADAEEKQLQQRAVKRWLKSLEAVAFQADNVFDELNYEMLRRKVEIQNPDQLKAEVKVKVCFFFSFSHTAAFRWRMARKIRDINAKLKMINQEANGFGLEISQLGSVANTINTLSIVSRETDSVAAQNVVGRALDASKIVQKLLSPCADVLSFLPITGMGGRGKTTLAQLVYNHEQIEGHFNKRIWVCVSDSFEVTGILKLTLESLTRRRVEVTSRDAIVQEIKKELEGQKYLLVLDDVWNKIPELWHDFLRSLVGTTSTQGNWSIITTRNLKVSLNLVRSHPVTLERLSDDDCWSIVKEKALVGDEVPLEMEEIREKIKRLCQGLPLAASVIGGLLRIKDKGEWLSIVDKGILNIRGDENSVLQILKLSFDHLPSSSIKKCFAYCSLFSKDSSIKKEELIQLWMAEGFLQPDLDNEIEKTMEEIGDDNFNILLQSSLLQQERDGRDGTVSGRFHNLVHELAQFVSKSEAINKKDRVRDKKCHAIYLASHSLDHEEETILKNRSSALRTLFLDSDEYDNRILSFKHLRVLKLSGTSTEELPTSINKLRHLRYLDISHSRIKTIPDSLCELYLLQTLRVDGCHLLDKLPKGLSDLISLRHLYFDMHDRNYALRPMPIGIGKLTDLRTLKFFNVSAENDCQIKDLGNLTNLGGQLEIHNLEHVNCKEEAEQANLVAKPSLLQLKLVWGNVIDDGEGRGKQDELVLEGLEPHPNLQVLTIKGFMGTQFATWLTTNMANKLVELTLRECNKCTEMPTLGHLPFLKYLKLEGLKNVTCIGPSFYGTNYCNSEVGRCSDKIFPSLTSLVVSWMPNLIEWKEAETTTLSTSGGEKVMPEVFPKLESLSIENCTGLTTAPSHFPRLKDLRMEYVNHPLLERNICSKVTTLVNIVVSNTGGQFERTPDALFSNNTYLSSLCLGRCRALTGVLGGCSTSLRKLIIWDCNNLEKLPKDLFKFCSLEVLHIHGCPNLESIPIPVPTSSSVQEYGPRMESLRELEIRDCQGLKRLPGELLESSTSLENLSVSNCPNLQSFPVDLQRMPFLSSLSLYYCPKLMVTMPKASDCSSSSLRKLWMGPFSLEFDWSGLPPLACLSELRFFGWAHAESLPQQLKCLTSLTVLALYDFGIEDLPDWFGDLMSLEDLRICNCKKLRNLPSTAALRRLTKLRSLKISFCPLLKERCNPNIGTDSEWSKISHIPTIEIDNMPINQSGSVDIIFSQRWCSEDPEN